MRLLIKKATIISPNSKYHNKVRDILIKDGTVIKIAASITEKVNKIIKHAGLHVSEGWIDMQTNLCDPGYEYKENIDSGLLAAAKGGFTKVLVLPQTLPVVDSKTSIEYLLKKASTSVTELIAIGALTKGLNSKELAEMFDMHESGAIAFSNGKKYIDNPSLLKMGLLYCKNFNGLIISSANINNINPNAVMHEGNISTSLGLSGSPTIAEEISITRDISILKYTNGKLHFGTISTTEAINAIKRAKKEKLNISAGVAAYNLLLTDESLTSFDTNLKVDPPLRSKKEVNALINGIKNKTIDVICSDHKPENIENKKCEFEYAKAGMIGLQTTFSCANTALRNKINLSQIIELFTANPRKILGIPNSDISVGNKAEITLFNPNEKYTYTQDSIVSKSKNSPLLNIPLVGRVIGVVNKKKFILNK